MKILIIDNSALTMIDDDFTIEPGMGNFAKELRDLGNEIRFFGQLIPTTKTTVNAFSFNKNNIQVVGNKKIKCKILNYVVLYFKIIPQILHADFVYLFYPSSFRYVVILTKLFGKKYGLYVRGDLGIHDAYSDFIYKSAYTVYTVSGVFTDYVNKVSNNNNAHTIKPMLQFDYNDIVTDRIYTNKDTYELLFFARLTDAKGLKELILSMSLLIKTQSLHLTIVGTGQYIDEVENLIAQENLSEFITLEGGVYDLIKKQEYFKKADIYILPSYNEGFPRTLYEAMVFGIPIITTFVGGIPSLMKDKINALEIKVRSVDSIVEVVTDATNNYVEIMKPIAQNATLLISDLLAKEKLSHAESLNSELENLNK